MTLHIYEDLEQGTDEWLAARCGIVTASVVGQLISTRALTGINYPCPSCGASPDLPCMSKSRGVSDSGAPIKSIHAERVAVAAGDDSPPVVEVASNDTSRGLTTTLVAERITQYVDPIFPSRDMERGTMDEPYARDIYSERYAPATEVGFMVRQFDGFQIGYSPDGLVGDDGLIEIKSRKQKTQLKAFLDDEVPPENMAQIQCGLLVSGRKWLDYVSYCGGMPPYVKRVLPDPTWFAVIIAAAAALEYNAGHMIDRYMAATAGNPPTERIDHFAEMEITF